MRLPACTCPFAPPPFALSLYRWQVLESIGAEAVPLNSAAVMAAACSAARAPIAAPCDFEEEEGFQPALDALLASLDADARLSFIGRLVAQGQVTAVLKNRLEQLHYARVHPEVATEKIFRPVFIAGLPRTGTTFLHNLLSQDSARFRSPLHWEYVTFGRNSPLATENLLKNY